MKKPFKETRVGQWLKEHAPQVLDTIGDYVPWPVSGCVGLIKAAVSLVPGIKQEQVEEFNRIADEFEMEMTKLYYEEMANARSREIEMAKATGGRKDWTMTILAYIGVLGPIGLVIYLINHGFRGMDTGEAALIGGFIGILISSYPAVYNYHFGSSAGSANKQKTIDAAMAAASETDGK